MLKPHFGWSAQLVEYLGRYSHKIAISDQKVSFYYKDYKHGSVTKTMKLEADAEWLLFCNSLQMRHR